MNQDYKLGAIAILAVLIAILAVIGGIYGSSQNNHNFDIACIKSGKHVVYEVLPGQTTPKKECK